MRQYALTGLLNQILYWFLLHSNGVHFGSISIDCAIYIGSHLATRLFQSIHTNPSFTHHTSQLPVPNPSLNSALGSPISYHTYVTRHFPKFLPSSRSRSRSRSSSAEPRHSWDSSTPCACALVADRVFLFPTRQGLPPLISRLRLVVGAETRLGLSSSKTAACFPCKLGMLLLWAG